MGLIFFYLSHLLPECSLVSTAGLQSAHCFMTGLCVSLPFSSSLCDVRTSRLADDTSFLCTKFLVYGPLRD
jgi:hypothetical protein